MRGLSQSTDVQRNLCRQKAAGHDGPVLADRRRLRRGGADLDVQTGRLAVCSIAAPRGGRRTFEPSATGPDPDRRSLTMRPSLRITPPLR
jgi:hypothetical protein